MASPTETFIAAMQRAENAADARARQMWRGQRAAISELLDSVPAASSALLSHLTAAVLRAARELPSPTLAGDIYYAADELVASQTGESVASIEPIPPMSYDAWQSAASGIFIGEALRLQLAGADDAALRARLLTGRDGRASAWEMALNSLILATALIVWGSGNGLVVRMGRAAGERDGVDYEKQAIAHLDARTTPICKAVDRQVQPLDKPFRTTVGPQQNPPFHHRCRTAVVLYHESFERI